MGHANRLCRIRVKVQEQARWSAVLTLEEDRVAAITRRLEAYRWAAVRSSKCFEVTSAMQIARILENALKFQDQLPW